jgi:predicted deacetylase
VTARLVVSLAGIDTRTLHRCADLAEEMQKRQVPLSLLFAPRRDGAVADWVRTRRAAGDAVLMHGFDHSPEPRARRTVTLARRAEFGALPAHEAGLRLTAAASAMERLGLVTDSFAPPRWQASRGTLTALRRKGFALCADLHGVHDLTTDGVHRARVQGFAQTERGETLWCFTYVLAAARSARRGGLVRLAVDAADLVRPGPRQAVLDAIDIARHHGATGVTYPEVLKPVTVSRKASTGSVTVPAGI